MAIQSKPTRWTAASRSMDLIDHFYCHGEVNTASPYLGVRLTLELETKLAEFFASTGLAPDDLIRDALAGYFAELSQAMTTSRVAGYVTCGRQKQNRVRTGVPDPVS